MIPEKRYQQILRWLQEEGAVKASELAKNMNTSYETIRRDLKYLDGQGLLRRTAGGAVPVETTEKAEQYVRFLSRSEQNQSSKQEVARRAMRYIREQDVIALDSGTTALCLARLLKTSFRCLTVVTNSLAIANELSPALGFTIILTGGVYRPDECSLVADSNIPVLSQINIHTFFLTTCGLSAERGVTYQRMDEVPAQRRMMECAEKTIAIADSTKLGYSSLIKMCDIDALSCIITDSQATAEQVKPFIDRGIPVVRN